jgi:hypothetical protein
MLFLQGTRDELARLGVDYASNFRTPTGYRSLRLEGADHGFKVPRQNILPTLASRNRYLDNQYS